MFEKSNRHYATQHKKKLFVEFSLTNETIIQGEVFVAPEERLIDLLNDQRQFLPLEVGESEIRGIAKSSILEARVIAAEPVATKNPWRVLKLQSGASLAEARAAWMKQLKATHPDRIAALGLDESIEYAARKACQRINQAYEEIQRELKQPSADNTQRAVNA
ncbi:MAG: J domain-containing protein [bacterium]